MVVRESVSEKGCNMGFLHFDAGLLTAFKPLASFFPSWPTSGDAGRKAMCYLFWLWWEAQTTQSDPSQNPPLPEKLLQCHPCSLKPLSELLGILPSSPQRTSGEINLRIPSSCTCGITGLNIRAKSRVRG